MQRPHAIDDSRETTRVFGRRHPPKTTPGARACGTEMMATTSCLPQVRNNQPDKTTTTETTTSLPIKLSTDSLLPMTNYILPPSTGRQPARNRWVHLAATFDDTLSATDSLVLYVMQRCCCCCCCWTVCSAAARRTGAGLAAVSTHPWVGLDVALAP
eukprot:COSAG06_NODE_11009_length_1581_cov_203.719298_1_plen_156_part_01